MMFSKITVLFLLFASVASVSGSWLRGIAREIRDLQSVTVHCAYSCYYDCDGPACTTYGCMNDSVFGGCPHGYKLLDQKCDLNANGFCEEQDCCVAQEAQETCASNGGHCVSNCGNGNSGLNCNDACNALGIFTDKPKCNGLGNGNYDCSGVNNVCCGCFS